MNVRQIRPRFRRRTSGVRAGRTGCGQQGIAYRHEIRHRRARIRRPAARQESAAPRAGCGVYRLAGAWIDTFRDEPYAGPLTRYPQVLLTPHVGSFTVECRRRMEMEAVENLLEGLGRINAVSADGVR